MTYLRLLRHVSDVVRAQACHYCGGAKKLGSTNRTCPVCSGTGTCPGGR
ncbi:hypothetical protein ACFQY7_00090 [Actinomadura luteofluorescens]|uniref:DnaJ-class molecular chaperone n=1 Tax=Actinomadura luteofluorescens TaxID=46163 RepID=A0A7Y9JFS6_9ACTN|nr:hypothetical protein [Actinomadura luteofluorescens]NYD45579.1 DnaJ-class molecular chaperone [Actinomadura luteofluorescens]